jgi:hypothetical protein
MFNIQSKSDNILIIGKELHSSNEMDNICVLVMDSLIKNEPLGFILRIKLHTVQ